MRELILKMQVSLDGFVGGPNGEVDWIFSSLADDATDWVVETLWNAGVHIMGRRTFFDMAAHWPTSTWPYAAPMNQIPKAIFSRKGVDPSQKGDLTRAFEDAKRAKQAEGIAIPAEAKVHEKEWAETPVLTGDLAGEIARLKQQPGKPILAHGGASFVQSLVRLNLVDEYRLMIHPVAIGKGHGIFSGLDAPRHLRLVESKSFSAGAVAQVYRPVRPPLQGTVHDEGVDKSQGRMLESGRDRSDHGEP